MSFYLQVANKRRILYINMEKVALPHLRKSMAELAKRRNWDDKKIRQNWNR